MSVASGDGGGSGGGLNRWTTLKIKSVYENPWIKVDEHDVLTPAGTPGIYGVVTFKNLAIGVVPVDDRGRVTLVGQYRYALDLYSWEIPEGGGDPQLPPVISAQRELREETGLEAAHWHGLLTMHPSNSVSTEIAHLFVAWGLTQGEAEPEETEDLALRTVPLAEAFAMVVDGRITDSLTVAALLQLQVMLLSGTLPQGLAEILQRADAPAG
ncbi:NUDIX domain-containing protein [Inquilinus ginsengisoli]|uniref:NUDIX domain-containing protein n=1 Tax=Inquilinus ginsengisoli TaxID=363840 RepID=UPI003D19001F